jgi:hypothetical protein
MVITKKLIIAAASAGAIGAAGIGASAFAATSGSTSYPPIVQKIAGTFGLDPAKVNNVFKQQRQDSRQDRQGKLKNTLDQAVKDGKLTASQETALLHELDTLKSQLKSESQNDRRQNRQALKSQLEQWAKDNGISNLDEILPQPPAGMHHGMDNDGDTDDSSSAASG